MRRPSRNALIRTMADRLLPMLVAAMALLATLALAGAMATASLSARWETGAAAAIMVQLPPGADAQAAARRVSALPGVAQAVPVDRTRMGELLRPWLGGADHLPMPVLIEIQLMTLAGADALPAQLQSALPGATVEAHGVWVARLLVLMQTMQHLAWVVVALVAAVCGAMVVATARAGLIASRETMLILHDMGATDRMIVGMFSRRLAWLSALGGSIGVAAAIPVLILLGQLAFPIIGPVARIDFIGLLAIPLVIALLAWCVAQISVRLWLRALP